MRVLYCLSKDGQQDYIPISGEQEKKISKLINDKAMPSTFTLNGQRIVSDTIIGFTDKPDQPKVTSYQDYQAFRSRVLGSDWYQRSKKVKEAEASH